MEPRPLSLEPRPPFCNPIPSDRFRTEFLPPRSGTRARRLQGPSLRKVPRRLRREIWGRGSRPPPPPALGTSEHEGCRLGGCTASAEGSISPQEARRPLRRVAEMKVEDGAPLKLEMEAAAADSAALRVCGNCKRDVAAANFSLHEAHCQRFLAICPECEEPVALKDMKAHHGEAHQQVRCRLCHQAMQQYLLQHHEAEECPERPVQCRFCDLELPFQRLQPHLEACGSRTTSCWDCGKYVMYRTLEEHNATFHASHGPKATGGASPSLSAEPKDNICELCKGQFSDEQYLQHLNECAPLPQLLGLLSPGSPTEQDSKAEEKAVRPRSQGRGAPSLLGKPSLKPPKGKRVHSRLAFTALDPQVLEESGHREDPAYDQLAACNGCNILLPSPTLEKHERKCRQRKAASGQALRRSPRLSGRGESAGQHSPSKEAHGQL
ncbi:XIAP-associated factor 1 isoform X3 [Pogona vitticeps]